MEGGWKATARLPKMPGEYRSGNQRVPGPSSASGEAVGDRAQNHPLRGNPLSANRRPDATRWRRPASAIGLQPGEIMAGVPG